MKDNLVESGFFGDFGKDVPEDQQEDVLQRVVEAIWSEEGRYDGAVIIGMEELNVLNREAEGSIVIDGREHYFHVRDGDRAGTEILAWNSGEGLRPEPADPKALVPFQSRVSEALASGQARKFLEQWNADLTPGSERGDALHDLVSNAAYDAFFLRPARGNRISAIKLKPTATRSGARARPEPHARSFTWRPWHSCRCIVRTTGPHPLICCGAGTRRLIRQAASDQRCNGSAKLRLIVFPMAQVSTSHSKRGCSCESLASGRRPLTTRAWPERQCSAGVSVWCRLKGLIRRSCLKTRWPNSCRSWIPVWFRIPASIP